MPSVRRLCEAQSASGLQDAMCLQRCAGRAGRRREGESGRRMRKGCAAGRRDCTRDDGHELAGLRLGRGSG